MRIVQVGDVASVAPALTGAIGERADIRVLPFAQRGAQRSGYAKALLAPLRVFDAALVARRVRALRPDIIHIHWVPNGIVGLFTDVPWVLHCHGSDIRELNALRRAIFEPVIRRASAVVYSTPDLRTAVERLRSDAIYLPTPVRLPDLLPQERTWDVMLASRAASVKGAEIAFAGLATLHSDLPNLRSIAVDGPVFQPIASRLEFGPKETFLDHLGRSRVVVGQFRLAALGIAELEAMSLGRPVVSGADPALYPQPPPIRYARSANDVRREVRELLDNPEAADELGRRGRDWVARHFDPERIADTAMALYASLAPGA